LQDLASVQVADHGERHRSRHVVAVIEIGDVLRGDGLEAGPTVIVTRISGFHSELTLPEIGWQEPGRVEQGPHLFEELAWLCVDL
jgi:hypothetical protein